MVNYSNGKVYKIEPICDHDEGEVYIGSTTKQYLSQRMDKHRSNYKQWLRGKATNIKSYLLFEKYDVENCRIVLLESVYAKTKDELASREAHYIQNIKCVNKRIPMAMKSIGKAEYYKRRDQRRRIEQYDILNAKFSCKCGGEYTHKHRSTHFKTTKHQEYIDSEIQYEYVHEYQWEDGTPCSEQEYNESKIN